jgi:hypothetical protein
MPTDNPLHCHGECYSFCSVFCYEHIAKSNKSVLALTCMVEYCDNLLCGKRTVSEEKRSGRVGSYCSPARKICAINVFLKMHLLVVKTATLCYVERIIVFVTEIVTHAKFLTSSIVLKGMLLESVTVARPPPSVKTVLMCLTNVLGAETDHWSTTTPVDKKIL